MDKNHLDNKSRYTEPQLLAKENELKDMTCAWLCEE